DSTFIRVTITNHSEERRNITLLPMLWLRNTWQMGLLEGDTVPQIMQHSEGSASVEYPGMGQYLFTAYDGKELLFTNNESNNLRFGGTENPSPFVKDGFHEYLINGKEDAVSPEKKGTKCGA